MKDLQQFAEGLIQGGGFTSKPASTVYDQPFEKQIGFDQLSALAERTGRDNYATGRAFSPSSIKSLRKHPLQYIEYCKQPGKTEEQRLLDWYSPHRKHFLIGDVFEELVRHGLEKVLDTKYEIIEGKLTPTVKKSAREKGKLPVRLDDWKQCLRMHLTAKEIIPEYVERLRTCVFEAPAYDEIEVGPNKLLVGGYLDAVDFPDKWGTDIKTIDKISEAEKRVFEKFYGTYQYWIQPTTYHIRHPFDEFVFFFISKDEFPSILLLTLNRDQLDELLEYMKETIFSEACYYLENGFQERTSNFWKKPPTIRPKSRLFV